MLFSDIESIFREREFQDHTVVAKQLDALVHAIGQEQFSQLTAQYLVTMTLPEAALPENLKRFSAIVHDGVSLLIAETPYHRLKKVILSQLQLPRTCEAGERLLHLALHYPTLQKLGQVIARNSSVAEDVKRWLIQLEGEYQGDDSHDLITHIRTWQQRFFPDLKIQLSETILARASVAEVIRFSHHDDTANDSFAGVLKVLKPDIEYILKEELRILEKSLQFFETNSEKYALENMKITALFDAVRLDLAREIDLLAEQQNLDEAQDIYRHNNRIIIPRLQKFCSQRVTAMEYIAGTKITETDLPHNQRKKLACLLFEAVICIPLFQHREPSLFHGDPHAGNILAVVDREAERAAIALLDWTLAGHLSKNTRINLIGLLIGIVSEDTEKIGKALEELTEKTEGSTLKDRLPQHLSFLMAHPDYHKAHPLKRSFWLLEKLTMAGLLFSAELILFRKAFFTLEGVLEDLCPGFAMEKVMEEYLNGMILKEMPERLSAAFFSAADNSGNYKSMLSNEDLSKLSFHKSMEMWQHMMNNSMTLVEAQAKLSNDFFSYFKWYSR